MRILCIDFDDVIYNTRPIVEEALEEIEPKASEKYLRKILKTDGYTDDDIKQIENEHFDYKDRVLEEVDEKYKGLINYEEIFEYCDLFPGTIDYINYLMSNNYYDKVYVVSHCNVKREEDAKRKFLNRYFPGLELITVPFHKEKYAPNLKRTPSSKAEFFMEKTGITDLSNCTLIDDSTKNFNDWLSHGGVAIKYDRSLSLDLDEKRKEFDGKITNTLNPLIIESITAEAEYETKGKGK